MTHRSAALWLSLAALPWPVACTTPQAFTCDADAQCIKDGAAGRCEAEGVCSFPDAACPSGHRYGALAGELAGECVGDGTSGATTPGATTDAPSTEADGASSEPGATSTATHEPSTTDPATTAGDLGPYGQCSDASDCTEADSTCLPVRGAEAACAPPCEENEDCPSIEGSPSEAVCTTINMEAMGCLFFCTEAIECPAGMQCGLFMDVGVGFCGWPP